MGPGKGTVSGSWKMLEIASGHWRPPYIANYPELNWLAVSLHVYFVQSTIVANLRSFLIHYLQSYSHHLGLCSSLPIQGDRASWGQLLCAPIYWVVIYDFDLHYCDPTRVEFHVIVGELLVVWQQFVKILKAKIRFQNSITPLAASLTGIHCEAQRAVIWKWTYNALPSPH